MNRCFESSTSYFESMWEFLFIYNFEFMIFFWKWKKTVANMFWTKKNFIKKTMKLYTEKHIITIKPIVDYKINHVQKVEFSNCACHVFISFIFAENIFNKWAVFPFANLNNNNKKIFVYMWEFLLL